ncbi:hypothetical protein N7449_004146, partial [Penicillium cf. viridicatum]
ITLLKKSATENYKRAASYMFGAYIDEDSIREKDKRTPQTKGIYYQAVNLWTKRVDMYSFVKKYGIKGYTMGPSCAILYHALIKEFLRWYSHTARGQKAKNGRLVMISVLNYV